MTVKPAVLKTLRVNYAIKPAVLKTWRVNYDSQTGSFEDIEG